MQAPLRKPAEDTKWWNPGGDEQSEGEGVVATDRKTDEMPRTSRSLRQREILNFN